MRLPYTPTTPPPSASDETSAIYARVAARRHPRPLLPLDRALLHSPPVADGYNAFLGAIRSATVLDPAVLELAVCRVGALNGAMWEWRAHATLAVEAGVGRAALEAVLDTSTIATGADGSGEGGVGGLSRRERAVVRYTDAMTRDVRVDEEVFVALREWFGEREVVELTATIAAYNCVSRFLVALDVGELNGQEMRVPEDAQ